MLQWGEALHLDQVSKSSGTLVYELLFAVPPRVPFAEADP